MTIAIGRCILGHKPCVALAIRDDVPHQEIHASLESGVDMLEFRVDMFQNFDADAVCDYLEAFQDIPAIGTIRSEKEGGHWTQNEAARCSLYKEIMPYVNAIDIEIGATDINEDVIQAAKHSETTIIGSFHDFERTPESSVLKEILAQGKSLGVDIVKVAAHCANTDDLRTLTQFLVNHKNESLIVIGMGAAGAPSRIFFPFLGSLITYTFLGNPSAPGQFGCEATLNLIKQFSDGL